MSLLSCDTVTLAYDGVSVLNRVSFTVEKGDFLCILGENGSGKSTLLRGLLGLTRLASGTVTYTIKKSEIGYLPQQTQIQRDFPATVSEVVRSGCRKDKSKYKTALELLAIEDLEKTSYRELSGGQQQRVLLARALCATEELLLLDEPTNGLDPYIAADFYQIIHKLNVAGLTVVMVTHDLDALKDANKVLHLSAGTAFFGTKEEYLQSDRYREMRRGGRQG